MIGTITAVLRDPSPELRKCHYGYTVCKTLFCNIVLKCCKGAAELLKQVEMLLTLVSVCVKISKRSIIHPCRQIFCYTGCYQSHPVSKLSLGIIAG